MSEEKITDAEIISNEQKESEEKISAPKEVGNVIIKVFDTGAYSAECNGLIKDKFDLLETLMTISVETLRKIRGIS